MEKHQTTEFVIPLDKTSLLKENVERVCSLFSVDVSLTSDNHTSGPQWICLKGSDEGLREQAKTYIKSLCCSESKHCKELSPRVFENLKSGNGGKEVEKLTGAVLSFSGSKVYVQGEDLVVAMAFSEIERRIAEFKEQKELHTTFTKFADGDDLAHDAENIPERSTVDTTDIPPSMREFAHKLNYKDREIDAVVRTFGTEININQLLQELVKNSASTLQLSSASEDTNALPVARGSCPSPLPPRDTRILHARGAAPAITTRGRPEIFEADQHVKPFQADHLRSIVVDGSNVAMAHGNQQVFSCRGIKICVDYFKRRGHTDITVFVPMWRRQESRPESPITEQEILDELCRQNVLKFTPSRWSGNRHIVCYDDKFIVELADQNGGIIVSNDSFRDLLKENPRWKETIEQRTLMYTIVGDRFMPPDDPLGRRGPSLDDFLRKGSATHPKICPYLKNCTFGNRCKYYHPERDTQRQQEKAPVRNFPENPELPTTSSVVPGVTTSPSTTNQTTTTSANRNNSRNIVGDPRVSTLPQVVESRLEPRCTVSPSTLTSGNDNRQRDIVRDPRVSVPPPFQSYSYQRGRPDDIAVRGSGHYYPPYYGGSVYSDYRHPMASDYTARNLQYQEPPPMYHHDLNQFPQLPAAQWQPYPAHVPYASPSGMGYSAAAGQCTYVRTYFEAAPVPRHTFQGQGPQRDQVDSSNSEETRISKERFDSLVEKLNNIFEEVEEKTIIRVLRSHPQECADEDINKLAGFLLDAASHPN